MNLYYSNINELTNKQKLKYLTYITTISNFTTFTTFATFTNVTHVNWIEITKHINQIKLTEIRHSSIKLHNNVKNPEINNK